MAYQDSFDYSLGLGLFSSGVLASWDLDGTTIRTWLVIDLSTCLDSLLELLVTIGDSLEELGLDISSSDIELFLVVRILELHFVLIYELPEEITSDFEIFF